MRGHLILQRVIRLALITLLISACGGEKSETLTGFLEIDGVNVYYEMMGEGLPLVLIHGGGLDRRMWDDQFDTFSELYQVIRYDIPGFGKSDTPTSPFSNVAILSGLLTALNVEQAHLLGLSLGGRIAIDFALEYPQRVTSLTLVAPGMSGFAVPLEESQRIRAIMMVGAQEGAQKAAEKWLEDPYLVPAMENPACREKVRQLIFDNAEFWVRPSPEQIPRHIAAMRLSEISVPTLIIVGDRDVESIYTVVEILEGGIANSQKEVISGAGHIVNMEKAEEFNRSVLGFLNNLSP